MKMSVKPILSISSILIWIGFVAAISFMESWLKFQAPGVTIPIGLGIGRLVFGALNKVEWILFIIFIWSSFSYLKANMINIAFSSLVLFILLSQTFYLLPTLDARAELVITQQNLPKSNLHFYFIIAECMKLFLLSSLALNTIKFNISFKNQ